MNISFRAGDEEALALEYARAKKAKSWYRAAEELKDPSRLTEQDILALHYSDSGAQGDPGAVEILYRSVDGVKVLYGNYAYGDLDLDAVIRKLPMLKCLDSRGAFSPPYPFGGRLQVPEGWGYLYMGAMNHFFARDAIVERTGAYIKTVAREIGSWAVFDAVAWLCGARSDA